MFCDTRVGDSCHVTPEFFERCATKGYCWILCDVKIHYCVTRGMVT